MGKLVPSEVRRLGEDGLFIVWNSGVETRISSETLRKNCPAADSRAERGDTSHEKPLSTKPSMLRVVEHTKNEQLALKKIWAVGNYAIGMEWGDGHKTGIYSFDLLAELAGLQP